MEREIRAGDKLLRFEEPSPKQFEQFNGEAINLMIAFSHLQNFLENIETGKVASYSGIIEKQITAYKEASDGLKNLSSLFYGILNVGNSSIDGVKMTREVFDRAFNFESVDSADELMNCIKDYISLLSPTENEVKN